MAVESGRTLADAGLLTVEQAAARKRCPVSTLQRWIQGGKIPVVLAGSGRNRTVHLLWASDVDAFVPPPMGRPAGPAKKVDAPDTGKSGSRKKKGRKSRNP